MDDMSPLRQIADSMLAGPAHLYRPKDALRLDWGGGGGFGDNAGAPHGHNPPRGAVGYYWVKDANQDVTIDVLDATGQVVRSFSSAQDSLTRADSLRGLATKAARTDSLHRAGITASPHGHPDLGDAH